MTTLDSIQKGRVRAPRRTLLYGVHGVGKTNFGAMAENPIFVPTEDGLADVDCERFPLATKYADVLDDLAVLYSQDHGYRTVVLDSLDWLETLILARVCEQRSVESPEDIPYQKAYVYALRHWTEVIEGLDALRNDRGMAVVLIAHAKVERFNEPGSDGYDRYSPKLHRLASAKVQEWCDEVLFARYRVSTRQTDQGFNRKRTIAMGQGERIVCTTERPAHLAKNRLNLPDELPLDHRVYAAFCRGENPIPETEPSTEEGA